MYKLNWLMNYNTSKFYHHSKLFYFIFKNNYFPYLGLDGTSQSMNESCLGWELPENVEMAWIARPRHVICVHVSNDSWSIAVT